MNQLFIWKATQLPGSYLSEILIVNELIQNGRTSLSRFFAVFADSKVPLQHSLDLFTIAENFDLRRDHLLSTFANFSEKNFSYPLIRFGKFCERTK